METSSCRSSISLPDCDVGISVSYSAPCRYAVSHFHLHWQCYQCWAAGFPLHALRQSGFGLVVAPPNQTISYPAWHPSDVGPIPNRSSSISLNNINCLKEIPLKPILDLLQSNLPVAIQGADYVHANQILFHPL